MKSARLFKKAKELMPMGVNSPVRYYEPYPFFAKEARGCKIKDVDGNEYIDYCMAYGALLLGHAYKDIINAISKQLKYGSIYCTPTEQELELAELLHKSIAIAEKVRIMNTGAEATMHAIRLARAYTKKSKIIKFEGCYHGAYDYVLVKAGSGALEQELLISEGMLDCVAKNTIVLPYNDIYALEQALKDHDDVACIIIEPVIANMGLIMPEKGYLEKVAKVARDNDALLIFDEVVTGFRLALGGASEYFNIKPDLACYAKALSNGFAISALVGRKDVMALLAPEGNVYQASTFAGNPVSVTAAITSIKILRKNKKIYKELEKNTRIIVDAIRDMIKDYRLKATVNSIASMFQIFFTDSNVKDYDSVKRSDVRRFKAYFRELLKSKVFIPPSQFETCFLSYAHKEKDIKKSLDAIELALKKVK